MGKWCIFHHICLWWMICYQREAHLGLHALCTQVCLQLKKALFLTSSAALLVYSTHYDTVLQLGHLQQFFQKVHMALAVTYDPRSTVNARDQMIDLSLWESSSGTLEGGNCRLHMTGILKKQCTLSHGGPSVSPFQYFKGYWSGSPPASSSCSVNFPLSSVLAACCFWLLENNFLKGRPRQIDNLAYCAHLENGIQMCPYPA